MRTVTAILAAAMLMTLAAGAESRSPRAELAGIRLGMTEEAARERLAKQGAPASGARAKREEDEQETWSLRRGPWGYVTLGLAGGKVHWVTAFARRNGPRVRYRDLGSLDESRRTGTYLYIWRVPTRRDAPPYTVIARGGDSLFVTSVSLAS